MVESQSETNMERETEAMQYSGNIGFPVVGDQQERGKLLEHWD